MNTPDLRLERAGPLARLVIDNPSRRNAVSIAMWRRILDHCQTVEAESGLLAVVLSGAGEHFCSGADIGEFAEAFATVDTTREYNGLIQQALTALAMLGRPVIAGIEGSCFGGGVSLALQCDRIIAAENARFAITPAKIGLVYGHADTERLVQRIGVPAAKDLLFTGRTVDAATAKGLGLIDEIVGPGEAARASERYAGSLRAQSQSSIRAEKRLINGLAAGAATPGQFAAETGSAAASPDFTEGRRAFLAREAPKFPSSDPD